MASLTIEQIAELAHISRSTVSRVLNNHPNVRPAVRERVLNVINEQGYAPRAAARSLASQRTHMISILIPRTAGGLFVDPFFGYVIQRIAEAAAPLGYFLMLSIVSAEREQGFYERVLRSRPFDGVLMLSSDIDDPILPHLIRDSIPFVHFGSHPFFENMAWVDAEHRQGARLAVSHLVKLGHRRIATITGPLEMHAAIERRDGYKQGLLEARLPIVPEYIATGDWTQPSGYKAMQQLLALPQRPTAVFIASDTMAVGAIRAVTEAGLNVPEDVAIVGFDDLPLVGAYANPPLSTIRQPIDAMSAHAVKLLVDQIERREPAAHHVRLPVELVVRGSCGGDTSITAQAGIASSS